MSGLTLTYSDLSKVTGHQPHSLQFLEHLDLSGNKIKFFEPGVFSKLKKLKSLNLSNNLLKTLPDYVTCDLGSITVLNIAENAFSNLEFLKNLESLEEIVCCQNGLELSQTFIATYLCPSLQKIDGKTIEKNRQLVTEFKEKLKHICESIDAVQIPHHQHISSHQLEEDLIKRLKAKKPSVSCIPLKVKDFMVRNYCEKFVKRIFIPNQVMPVDSALERLSTESPPRHRKQSTEHSVEGTKMINSPASPADVDYTPSIFLRCHFGDKKALKEGHSLDDPTDEITNVWCCAFEPDPYNKERSVNVVATCGGCMVCLIDCSGKVLKRFSQTGEQFYCLAWTTLKIGNSNSNILAVSGNNGHLKLLFPSQLVCYSEYGNGRPNKAVKNFYYSSLLFHPTETTRLFCSSSDSTITLFDIGIPSGFNYSTEIKQLAIFNSSPSASIFNMILIQSREWLVGGTNNGLMVWEIADGEKKSKRKEPIKTITIAGLPSLKTVDGLTIINEEYFACKFVSHGLIYIYNTNNLDGGPTHRLKWHQTDCEFIGINYGNGILACGDDDGTTWLYRVDQLIQDSLVDSSPEHYKLLQWPTCEIDTNDPFDAKMVDVLDKPKPLIINSIAIQPSGEFMVTTTDCNVVCLWTATDIPKL